MRSIPAQSARASRNEAACRQDRLLPDRHDAQAGGLLQFAVVQGQAAGDDFEQRRLAGAIAADQADAFAGLED